MKPPSWTILAAGWLLVLIVYLPRLNAPLIWDDRPLIFFNVGFDRPIPFFDYFTPRYFDYSGEYSWRPLSTGAYRAILWAFDKSPWALRGFSLLFHLLVGLLLFGLLKSSKWPGETAAWAVALFWVHPANVESLMCAAFNKETLSAAGLLTMLWAHERRRTALASAGLAFAVLAKETGLAGLALTGLFDLCEGGMRRCRERAPAYGAYAGVAAAYAAMRFWMLQGPAAGLSIELGPLDRLYQALGSLLVAARVAAVPLRLRLEYFALPPDSGFDWFVRFFAAAALAAAAGVVLRSLWRKDRKLAFFWIWPLPFLLMTSNLFPAGALHTRLMAERWLYLPLLGWSVIASASLCRRPGSKARIPLAAIAVVFSLLSFVRAADWADEIRLWRRLEQVYPTSAKAVEGVGEAYARAGRWDEALPKFELAYLLREKRMDPVLSYYVPLSRGLLRWESPSLYRWLGQCEARRGGLDKAEGYFRKSVELDPADGFSFRMMALAFAEARRYDQARRWAEEGLRRDPHDELLLQIKARLPQ